MAKLKGKQIENNSLDLEKLRSGSKLLPNDATLGTEKEVGEITNSKEFVTKEYVENKFFKTDYRLAAQFEYQFKTDLFENFDLTIPGDSDPAFVACIYARGYIYTCNRTSAGITHFFKINPDDLSDYETFAFPDDARHRYCDQLIYVPSKGKIYAMFGDVGYTQTTIKITEIDPITLEYTDVITDNIGTITGPAPYMTSDGSFLYVISFYYNPRVLKYDLSTMSRIGNIAIANWSGVIGRFLEYDGEFLYAGSIYGSTQRIAKINPTTLSVVTEANIGVGAVNPADDVALVGDYLWFGVEGFATGTIYRVRKDDFTKVDTLYIGFNSKCYGIAFDGTYIWGTFDNGKMVKIDPMSLEMVVVDVNMGSKVIEDFVTDGNRIYFTYEDFEGTAGSGVGRITIPNIGGDVTFLHTDGTHKMKMGTNGSVSIPKVGAIANYTADFSGSYTNRSLVDKEYVDNAIADSSTVAAGEGLISSTSGVLDVNVGSGIAIESDSVVLDVRNYSDSDAISMTSTDTTGVTLSYTDGATNTNSIKVDSTEFNTTVTNGTDTAHIKTDLTNGLDATVTSNSGADTTYLKASPNNVRTNVLNSGNTTDIQVTPGGLDFDLTTGSGNNSFVLNPGGIDFDLTNGSAVTTMDVNPGGLSLSLNNGKQNSMSLNPGNFNMQINNAGDIGYFMLDETTISTYNEYGNFSINNGGIYLSTNVGGEGGFFQISGSEAHIFAPGNGNIQWDADGSFELQSGNGFFITSSSSGGTIVYAPTGGLQYGANYIGSFVDRSLVDKEYVDYVTSSVASGLDPKASVRFATTANLSWTYNEDTSGTVVPAPGSQDSLVKGSAITSVDFDSATTAGFTLQVGDRILVKNQTDAKQNGIYQITNLSTGTIVRASDQDGSPTNEVSGGNYTFVENGTYENIGFVLQGDGDLTINTDNLSWVQFSGAGQITAGSGLSKTANTLNVNTGSGIAIEGDNVVLDITNYSDSDQISLTTSNASGISLTASNGNVDISGTTSMTIEIDGGSETLMTIDSHGADLDVKSSEGGAITIEANGGGITIQDIDGGGVYFEDPNGGGTYFNDSNGGGVYVNGSADAGFYATIGTQSISIDAGGFAVSAPSNDMVLSGSNFNVTATGTTTITSNSFTNITSLDTITITSPSSDIAMTAPSSDINISSGGLTTIDGVEVNLSSTSVNLHLNGGGVYTDIAGTNGGLKYAADYSSTYTSRSLVDKAYVDGLITGSSLNTNYTYENTGVAASGTAGTAYGNSSTFTFSVNAVTDADVFINGIKLRKSEYYFDTPGNYKPLASGSTLYFNFAVMPYTVDTDDYVEIEYFS